MKPYHILELFEPTLWSDQKKSMISDESAEISAYAEHDFNPRDFNTINSDTQASSTSDTTSTSRSGRSSSSSTSYNASKLDDMKKCPKMDKTVSFVSGNTIVLDLEYEQKKINDLIEAAEERRLSLERSAKTFSSVSESSKGASSTSYEIESVSESESERTKKSRIFVDLVSSESVDSDALDDAAYDNTVDVALENMTSLQERIGRTTDPEEKKEMIKTFQNLRDAVKDLYESSKDESKASERLNSILDEMSGQAKSLKMKCPLCGSRNGGVFSEQIKDWAHKEMVEIDLIRRVTNVSEAEEGYYGFELYRRWKEQTSSGFS